MTKSSVELVAAVWEHVLRHPVGADQNFFEVGGDSLLLLEVHAELESRLGRQIELLDLLQYPTISALASALARSEQ